MSLKFGLNIQKKGPGLQNKPTLSKRPAAFGGDASDDEDTLPTTHNDSSITTFDVSSTNSINTTAPPAPTIKPKPTTTTNRTDLSTLRSISTRQAEAESIDPTIYDYDSAYDAIHAKSAAAAAASKQDALERKPKYMNKLLEAAEVRKRDQLRAKDRLLQKQREEEGDEFADKDAFVTEAYKKQQEDVKKVEEEEARKEELEAKKRQGKGMSGFYRSVMEQEELQHREVVEAAAKAQTGAKVEVDAEADHEKSAMEQAKELNEKGAKVMINEEGQVVDKRQLLNAGLNVAPKRKADGTMAAVATAQRPVQQQAYRGKTDAQKAMRERQTRMMEEQLEAAAKKAAQEEEEERQKVERAAKSRKTETDVSSARERYLQRKKEAEEAKARGEQ